MSSTYLFKYLSIADPKHWDFRRKLLADRQIYFSDPRDFNDPLDCVLLKSEIGKTALKTIKIFCLSEEKRDDTLMFSHYGDSHRGFRLKFEIDADKPISECSALELGEFVKYRKRIPKLQKSNVHRAPFLKSIAWAYEAEYRILNVRENPLTYPIDCLVEVAFGFRMNQDFESVIRKWVKDGGHTRTRFSKAIPSGNSLSFKYKRT